MSNQAIIDQLANINTRLDKGINIRGVKENTDQTPVLLPVDNNNRLKVSADISGSINYASSSILVYGENYTDLKKYSISVGTNGKVNVNDTGSQSYLASIDMKLTSTSNKLQVQDTAVNTSLNTIITKLNSIITPTRYGSHNNVYSGNLAVSASSNALDISLYKNAVISYNDTSYTLNNTLQIIASSDSISGDYDYIGLLIPITNTTTSKRYASAILELSPFKYLKITNLSGDTVNDISCSLYGSG